MLEIMHVCVKTVNWVVYQDCESKNILGEHILPNNMKFKQKAWNDESSDDESDNEEMEDEEECDISDAVHMIGANDDFNPQFSLCC